MAKKSALQEHKTALAKKGGLAVKKKYGKGYFSNLAKEGWKKRRKALKAKSK